MYTFINNVDRTSNVSRDNIRINSELQERINKATFKADGFTPSEYEEVRIFDGFKILSSTANSVTLDREYKLNELNQMFRVGSIVYVALNLSDEEKGTVSSISDDGDNLKLTFSANFTAQPVATELCGKLIFAGNIINLKDKNIKNNLGYLEYSVTCLDYTRLFDKENINDSWEDRTARYIINDFCNSSINKNLSIDTMEYEIDGDIQAEWIEAGDGDNPTTDSSDFMEGDYSGVFPWTFNVGTATWTASPVSQNVSGFTGVASGAPTKGILAFWYKCADYTKVTNFKPRIGSGGGDHAAITVTPNSNEWVYVREKLKDAAITGNPDWTVMDYADFIVEQTGDSSIKIDGIRIMEEESFKHYSYVEDTPEFGDFRVPQVKPTETMQRIADGLKWYWDIDYERNIRLFPETTNVAPFEITETSDNFKDLSVSYDTSRLINRQVVLGSEEAAVSVYPQKDEGNSIRREWLTKSKFKNLEVFMDDNSVNDLAEAGTTATNIKIAGHGLVSGDFIVNRSRSNAVREIVKVDVDNYTVDTVAAQVPGDTISNFVEKTVGVEGLDEEASYNYMSNFKEKSIRATATTDTLIAGEFILFRYNEIVQIAVRRINAVSINNMENIIGYTNGIFDGQQVTDRKIKSRPEATAVADATLHKYGNMIITAKFTTHVEGLATGQLIRIKDTTHATRNLDQQFVIQRIVQTQEGEGENKFAVTCSSLLYGMLELLQQLLRHDRKMEVWEDAQIILYIDAPEIFTMSDSLTAIVNGEEFPETMDIADSLDTIVFTPPYKWGPHADEGRWNFAEWS